ncbi:phenylalanine--tRNA ligase subunit beta [Patescibacteria group bacterium]|nr:phenylalanine--tRNA ligase subunit beta [Patescibacteria group bacterium]
MKISYKWLKECVDVDLTPEELAEVLTMHSFEVENIIYQGKGLDNVVVGEVLAKEMHPDADNLSIVKVNVVATGAKPLQLCIVCGASNINVGQKVAVALVGAKLPSGMIIEKRKVRGVESCGMVCAEDELGLGKNHEGIMVLNEKCKVGMSAQEVFGLDDVIFEIDILPNRAHDCLSHYGVAREVAVLLEKNIKYQISSIKQISKSSDILKINIENVQLCRRYSAAVVNNVEIKESPSWLKNRLESCGVRSINNIVDITNCVMFSIGQPMHAFDAGKIQGKIVVRNAKIGEKLMALDEKEYKLTEEDLVIADENSPIAIAGVMGGLETAVDENTKNIIFEAANFQGTNIRKTAARLKLASESSYRFEREIDEELTLEAISKAIEMTKDLAGGKLQGDVIDIYSNQAEKRTIKFSFERIENLLGIKIEKEKVFRILTSLGFMVSEEDKEIEVLVPSFRKDVQKTNDIIEEIGRINGYGNIKEAPANIQMKSVTQDRTLLLEKNIKKSFEGLGFFEVYNYSFIGEKEIKGSLLKIENHHELQNPLSEEFMYMRTNLLPDLLNNARDNLKHRESLKLFELGKIYLQGDNEGIDEKKVLSGVMACKGQKEVSFYDLKGQLEVVLKKNGIEKLSYRKIENSENFWHKGRSAEIMSQKQLIARAGEIHPIVLNNFGLSTRVVYFEIYIDVLADLITDTKRYKKINKFPRVELDLSVVFDESMPWGEIQKAINKADNNLVQAVEPFDIYRGENLGENKKSIAFRVSYQAQDRTLTDEEVKTVQNKIVGELEKFGGEVRS